MHTPTASRASEVNSPAKTAVIIAGPALIALIPMAAAPAMPAMASHFAAEGHGPLFAQMVMTIPAVLLIVSATVTGILADIVGPVCETGDYLGLAREMPEPKPGDLLAVLTAGAYGAAQSGTYNTRPLIPEVLVDGPRFAVIRARESVEELIAREHAPEWVAAV